MICTPGTCMCYDSCGKKEASAFVHCNAGLEEKPATEFPKAGNTSLRWLCF